MGSNHTHQKIDISKPRLLVELFVNFFAVNDIELY